MISHRDSADLLMPLHQRFKPLLPPDIVSGMGVVELALVQAVRPIDVVAAHGIATSLSVGPVATSVAKACG